MSSITIEQAQAELPQLVDKLEPGEEIEITKNQETVAKLVGQKRSRKFGLGKGKLVIVEEDDSHLAEFKDYMP